MSPRRPLHLAVGLLLSIVLVGVGSLSRTAHPESQAELAIESPAEPSDVASAAFPGIDEAQAPTPEEIAAWSAAAAPVGGHDDLARSRAINGSALVKPFTYVVEPGDSLGTIALRFGVDVLTLLGSNEIDDPDLLPAGREVTVLPIPGVLYTVADGDTLNQIASRYEVEVLEILKANDLESSEMIQVGQDLVLPGAKPLLARPAAQTDVAATAEDAVADSGGSAALASLVTPPRAAPATSLIWPTSGRITSYFGQVGWTSPRGHAGLDIAAPWGAPISAAASGQVVLSTRAGGAYGYQIIIDHGSGLRTVYGHLSRLDVETGERVSSGELIGLVGSTGFSTGPHLHFEVRRHGELLDPLRFLP